MNATVKALTDGCEVSVTLATSDVQITIQNGSESRFWGVRLTPINARFLAASLIALAEEAER